VRDRGSLGGWRCFVRCCFAASFLRTFILYFTGVHHTPSPTLRMANSDHSGRSTLSFRTCPPPLSQKIREDSPHRVASRVTSRVNGVNAAFPVDFAAELARNIPAMNQSQRLPHRCCGGMRKMGKPPHAALAQPPNALRARHRGGES
jgi:hypothetical protein